jgi:hypothetical protein
MSYGCKGQEKEKLVIESKEVKKKEGRKAGNSCPVKH